MDSTDTLILSPEGRAMAIRHICDKIREYCNLFELPAETFALAMDILDRAENLGIPGKWDPRAFPGVCIFMACRQLGESRFLSTIVETTGASMQTTLKALWHLEDCLDETPIRLEIQVSWRPSEKLDSFRINGGPRHEAKLYWPGGPELVIMGHYATDSPRLRDLREWKLDSERKASGDGAMIWTRQGATKNAVPDSYMPSGSEELSRTGKHARTEMADEAAPISEKRTRTASVSSSSSQ